MKLNFSTRFLSLLLTFAMVLGCTAFVSAKENTASGQSPEIIFTDVTDKRSDVLEGEAKIMVSIQGVEGVASIIQVALEFDTLKDSLKYKSITFLKGENNPPECVLITPNAALVNSKKELTPSIISIDESVTLSGKTDLFVLTFASKNPKDADEVVVSLNDNLENTYCIIDGKEFTAAEKTSSSPVSATDKATKGITATVKLTMDVITDFAAPTGSGYKNSGIELKISGEKNKGYTIYSVLNNANISKGGHRVGSGDTEFPTFIIENTVLAEDPNTSENETYTVEISGIGYVPCVIKNVDFSKPLELTNKDFVPGDVDGDGKVTTDDKLMFMEIMAENSENEACDFNRDGEVDEHDFVAFSNINEEEEEISVPSKIQSLKAEGGHKSATLTWSAPANNGGAEITGYTVKYGTTEDNLDKSRKTEGTSVTIDGLEDNTTYYFSVTAENKAGSSESCAAVSATTSSVPGKVKNVKVTGGTNKITVSWSAPENGNSPITEYIIKYGLKTSSLTNEVKAKETQTQLSISNLSASTTYYVKVAAVNAVGTGEYSSVTYGITSTPGGGGAGNNPGSGGTVGGGSAGAGAIPGAVTTYTVTYDTGAGKIASGSAVTKVEMNQKVANAPTVIAPEGMEFVGWSRDNGASFINPANVIVKSDITFTAIYKSITESGNTTNEIFTDITDYAWAEEAIYTLKSAGIINGTSATTFSPANNIKRGDFILILVRMLGIDGERGENFNDVPADSYYADAILKARAAGIANGYEDNTFRPEDSITRQDLITLAMRAYLAKGIIEEAKDTASLDEFGDKSAISDYALTAMASMVKAGIIKGSGGNVNPTSFATRAEVAVMCASLLTLIK